MGFFRWCTVPVCVGGQLYRYSTVFPIALFLFFARAWLLYALQTHVIPFFFLLLSCVFLLLLEMDIKENGAAPRRRERPARKGLSSPVERKPSENPAETRWER